MEQHFLDIIKAIGEDPTRESLRDTPRRAAKTLRFLTKGYRQCVDQLVKDAVFTWDADEIILVKDIALYSLCEHHLLPFIGTCNIAYLPNGKIIGLTAFPRLVNLYARRLQIQEKLTLEIAQCIANVTQAKGVKVTIEAKHLCMAMRGVKEQNAILKTAVQLGRCHTGSQAEVDIIDL